MAGSLGALQDAPGLPAICSSFLLWFLGLGLGLTAIYAPDVVLDICTPTVA